MVSQLDLLARLHRHFTIGSGCWEWTGPTMSNGYAQTRDAEQRRGLVHRIVYEAMVGPIPEGMEIDHLCRNRRCVKPEHLEVVTKQENNRRAAIAHTHCKRGHEFTPENLYIQPSTGYRTCLTCKLATARDGMRRARLAQKGAQS